MSDTTTPGAASPERSGELAEVHYLPTVHIDPDDTAGEPLDGELITEEEYERLTSQKAQALARYEGYRRDITTAARVVRTLMTHQRTAPAWRAGGRVAVTMWEGTKSGGRRAWSGMTHGYVREQIRQARVAGKPEELAEWTDRLRVLRNDRRNALQNLPHTVWSVVKATLVTLTVLAGILLVTGVWMQFSPGGEDFMSMVHTVVAVVETVAAVTGFLWAPALIGLGLTALVAAYREGIRHGEVPMWLQANQNQPDQRDLVPDEGAIINALRELGLPPLNKKFKEGWKPRWVQGTGRDGKGWRTQLELPPGVTVEMINDKKDVLAHNLVRLPVEVWPTEPKKQPGVLDLWVADHGLLTGLVDPYPLLTEGETDYFKGVPVGIDQRGTEMTGRLMASNYAVAGIMGSGKTSLVINLLCGAMLDPLVDIDVFVMAFNADYDPMVARLRHLVKGDEDDQITRAMDALRALRADVTEKGKILSDLGGEETKLTREIAEKYPRMRPKVTVFDECQELFRHEKYGEEAKQLAIKVMMKARKCGETLIWVTPAPSADSLPRDLAKTVSHRVCFAIGDHQGNDAILGTGAHKQGITATNLVAGEDIGTAMASGFAARPGLLRTHHIRKEKGIDEITPIVQRGLALRAEAGIVSAGQKAISAPEERDLLHDLAAVLDQSPVKSADVPPLLRDLAPGWPPYQSLTGTELRAWLDREYGITVPSTKNLYPVDPVTIRQHIARRVTDETDTDD